MVGTCTWRLGLPVELKQLFGILTVDLPKHILCSLPSLAPNDLPEEVFPARALGLGDLYETNLAARQLDLPLVLILKHHFELGVWIERRGSTLMQVCPFRRSGAIVGLVAPKCIDLQNEQADCGKIIELIPVPFTDEQMDHCQIQCVVKAGAYPPATTPTDVTKLVIDVPLTGPAVIKQIMMNEGELIHLAKGVLDLLPDIESARATRLH